MRSLIGYAVIFLVLFTSCKGGGGKKEKDMFVVPDSLTSENTTLLEEEVTEDIIDNLASPVEVAELLNRLEVPYTNRFLYPASEVEKMETDIQKAYGLGLYGADLGYQAMYGKNTQILDYISNIKELSEGLRIGQFFDFKTLKRLSENRANLDSLMYLAVHSFNEIDKYLRKQHRGEISAMIITGLWLEGMYLATQLQKEYPHPELKERIGEQKIIMEDLFTLLRRYQENKEIKDLLARLTPLKDLFQEVKITVKPGEPETMEKDGRLVIVQHEESIVEYSDELLGKIIKEIETLRGDILGK